MKAALLVISGSVQESIITLSDGAEVTIGRGSHNRLSVEDRAVSRSHCTIRAENGDFVLRDAGSHGGTFVNGASVDKRVLAHADSIRIGQTVFMFVRSDEGAATFANEIELDAGDVSGSNVTESPATETIAADQDQLRPMARVMRDLHAIVKIATHLGTVHEVEAIAWQLLGMLFSIVPADRGALILFGGRNDELRSAAAWDREHGPDRQVRVSRTVLDRVLNRKTALLVRDVAADAAFANAQSLAGAGARSVVCAPLLYADGAIGAIYFESSGAAGRFDEGHLQLLSAAAGVATLAIENARRFQQLRAENRALRIQAAVNSEIVGASTAIQKLLGTIAKVAPTESSVLITGESGTGKELVARAIHQSSTRADKPLLPLNCAALTETLLESEMFGHERGAFTGAAAMKKGLFESAEGGTVFLDEIGELAPALQAKLLRVLQEREVRRVGASRSTKVDVRVLAATNRDLQEQVRAGAFRSDLYYRLNVVSVHVPALRERRSDIPLLAAYFVEQFAERCKRRLTGISDEALRCLTAYDWPGNVRELANAIERAVVLGSESVIVQEDLPENIVERLSQGSPERSKYHSAVAEQRKQIIIDAVEQAGGNITEAARLLGLHPNYLHRLLNQLNLRQLIKKAQNA